MVFRYYERFWSQGIPGAEENSLFESDAEKLYVRNTVPFFSEFAFADVLLYVPIVRAVFLASNQPNAASLTTETTYNRPLKMDFK